MTKIIRIEIGGASSKDDKILLETELEVLKGVEKVETSENNDELRVEFDEEKTSQEEISAVLKRLSYKIDEPEKKFPADLKEKRYFVQGMHCASCELLIEKKLLSAKRIKSVEASAAKGEVVIEYTGGKPSLYKLNEIFKKDNYVFSDEPQESKNDSKSSLFINIGIALLIFLGFLGLNKLGLSGLVNVSSSSSLPAFFVFGLLAGVSSCAALVGGMILSMSKQWSNIYDSKESTLKKLQPHFMFNAGRLLSYIVLGAVLGAIGSKLQISLKFTSVLVIGVSAMMLLLALQMLGVKALRKFQVAMPKFITRYVADETNFQGRYMPSLMGALTFFLPCGFTITAQGLALISGSALQGGLIMFLFALGTAPGLLAIGLSSIKFSQKPHLSSRFLKIAGALVLFFAFSNINNQLNVLGVASLNNIFIQSSSASSKEGLAPIVNGKQVLKMDASSSGYSPNYFKIKAGLPVRWEITDTGTSGCTNAVISKGLFDGDIPLTPGQTSIKEFTASKPGKYKFSCWMGMVSGIIEVVDSNAAASQNGSSGGSSSGDEAVVPSGAKGCGCGGCGGGGSGGSCGAK